MSSDGSGNKYAETEEILKEVVGLFSLKSDPAIVRDAGRAIVELQSSAQKRHAEMLAAIKELSGVVESAHKDHEGLELTANKYGDKQASLAQERRTLNQRIEQQRHTNQGAARPPTPHTPTSPTPTPPHHTPPLQPP